MDWIYSSFTTSIHSYLSVQGRKEKVVATNMAKCRDNKNAASDRSKYTFYTDLMKNTEKIFMWFLYVE